MEKELSYYEVDGDYGWDQDKFPGFLMKFGGCAAVTACESCIYFTRYEGVAGLYPYDAANITREDFIRFSNEMKPYLHPRMGGIDTLQLYMNGFGAFLKDKGCTALRMTPFEGTGDVKEAREKITAQIDRGFPIPYLMLKHKNKLLDDYTWHWFMLTGYRTDPAGGAFEVKVVTFGKPVWFGLEDMWNTGYERRGGMILFELQR